MIFGVLLVFLVSVNDIWSIIVLVFLVGVNDI